MGVAAIAMAGVQAGLTLNQANQESKSQKAQAAYQKTMFDINASQAELQADDAIRRGDKDAQKATLQGRQTIGAQRAALAAQGIEVDSGTALELQADTRVAAAQDAMTIRNNAWREAWGFKAEALNASLQGRMSTIAGNARANATMTTGGIQAFNQFGNGLSNSGAFTKSSSSSAPKSSGTATAGSAQSQGNIA